MASSAFVSEMCTRCHSEASSMLTNELVACQGHTWPRWEVWQPWEPRFGRNHGLMHLPSQRAYGEAVIKLHSCLGSLFFLVALFWRSWSFLRLENLCKHNGELFITREDADVEHWVLTSSAFWRYFWSKNSGPAPPVNWMSRLFCKMLLCTMEDILK